jgi:hypothetical protein
MRGSPNAPALQGSFDNLPEHTSARLDGLWPALVEYVLDPLQMGRVRVRVYHLFGPQGTDIKTKVPTDQLPWAMPCFPFAGGNDYGSFMIPPVGSTVWVAAASGNPEVLVYLGGFYAINKEAQEYLRTMGFPTAEISMAGSSDVWTGPKGPEMPIEALQMLHGSPEVMVPAKSVKGAAIVFDDKDERENVSVVDRAGQGLFMEGEVQKGPNLKNARQRGHKLAAKGEPPITVGDTVANETRVFLVDAAGQAVLMHAHQGSERIKIVSRPVEGDNTNYAGHKEEMSVELDAGSKRIVLASSSGGDAGARVVLDAAAGYIELTGPVVLRINAQSLEVLGRATVKGDLFVEGDCLIGGDQIIVGEQAGGELK